MLLAVSIIAAICNAYPSPVTPTLPPTPKPPATSLTIQSDDASLASLVLEWPYDPNYPTTRWDRNWIGADDCNIVCNEYNPNDQTSGKWDNGNFKCYDIRRYFWDCDCELCQRDCLITEQFSSCDISPIPERVTDIRDHLHTLLEDLHANLLGAIPIIGPLFTAGMHFANGIFRAVEDSENGLLNGVIDDINQRHEQLQQCMNEQIDLVHVQSNVNAMHRAFVLYGLAAYVPGSDGIARKEKLNVAWNEYMLTANVEFGANIDGQSATYFKELLFPLQDFAQSFVLCTTDYLIHLKGTNDATYGLIFRQSIESFERLRIWTLAAQDAILADVEETKNGFSSQPCRNADSFDAQIVAWKNDFFSVDYMLPLGAFIKDLDDLDFILTGGVRPYVLAEPAANWYDQGLVCRNRYYHEYGMIRSEEEREMAVRRAGYARVWTGLHALNGQWRWYSREYLCVGAPGLDCRELPFWAPGQPERDEGCAYMDEDGLLYVGDCDMHLPALCVCIGSPCAEN